MNKCLVFSFLTVGCVSATSPEEVFKATKEKFYKAEEVSFTHKMLWENPNLGEVDTIFKELILQKNQNRHFEYNYIGKREISEIAYVDDVLLFINHKDSTLTYYSEQTDWDYINLASANGHIDFSPVNLLKKEPWIYKQDTAINQKVYLDFFRIDMDTTINDKKIYLENHLFINPASLLVERYSRRLYHNGRRSQLIENEFKDYNLGAISKRIQAVAPEGYLSVVPGEKRETPPKLLAVGESAPDFDLLDLEGNSVRLSSLRGNRVLLDFSMINCGWCKIALEKFNKPDFEFADDIVPFYVNPVDSKEKMEKYRSRTEIPFTILVDAKEVGEAYGVRGYPTFYLIDDKGIIEEVFEGFDDTLVDRIKRLND